MKMSMNNLPPIPVEYLYGFLAVTGGIARYLTGFANGKPFKFSIFVASIFVSGFSGYMFALLAISLQLPLAMQFMIAGIGGYQGEQTLKLIIEKVVSKIIK